MAECSNLLWISMLSIRQCTEKLAWWGLKEILTYGHRDTALEGVRYCLFSKIITLHLPLPLGPKSSLTMAFFFSFFYFYLFFIFLFFGASLTVEGMHFFLKFNRKASSWLHHNIHSTITPMDISFHAGYYSSLHGSQLDKTGFAHPDPSSGLHRTFCN